VDPELVSAIVVVALVAGVVRLTGASWRQTALLVGMLAVGIAATALFWNWITSHE
jgi:cell division protein FtsW (lipid II flippase)